MGFRLYRSFSLGKGLRLYLSKTGPGVSAGAPGFRTSVHASGRRTRTVGLPGTGLSYRTQHAGTSGRKGRARAAPLPPVVALPRARLFSPRDEKSFVRGITAYVRGDHEAALAAFGESMARDTSEAHVAEEYFAAFSLLALDRHDEAIEELRKVLASPVEIPDPLMRDYSVAGETVVRITPELTATLPHSNLAAALLLAELLQHTGRTQEAAELLESLGSTAPDAAFALSLADLYVDLERWEDVVRVTDGFTANTDDLTCLLLAYRARALRRQDMGEGALALLREALKPRKRDRQVLLVARYERALTYEDLGRGGRARKDLERIYAEDSAFADVADRLAARHG